MKKKSAAKDTGKISRDMVGSMVHGLNVIKSFDSDHPQMTLTQVAERTALTRAGARRYLLTLVHLGYVIQEDRLFRLSAKVLELGYSYLSSVPLSTIAEPYLRKIRDKTGEAVALAVLDHDSIIHIARVNSDKLMAPTLSVGKRFEALYTSTGRMLLAMEDENFIDEILSGANLVKNTQWSITNKSELKEELKTIRRNRYAVVDQEIEKGVRALAVPIMNNKSETVAAMNIVTNAAAIPKKQLIEEFLPVLKDVSRELQLALIGTNK